MTIKDISEAVLPEHIESLRRRSKDWHSLTSPIANKFHYFAMNLILPLFTFIVFLTLIRQSSSLCSTTSSCQIYFGLEASCIESVCVCKSGFISKVATTCESGDVLPDKAKETDPWIRVEYLLLLGTLVVLALFSVYIYRRWKRKNEPLDNNNSSNNNSSKSSSSSSKRSNSNNNSNSIKNSKPPALDSPGPSSLPV